MFKASATVKPTVTLPGDALADPDALTRLEEAAELAYEMDD
jgi:hypothetical protein